MFQIYGTAKDINKTNKIMGKIKIVSIM